MNENTSHVCRIESVSIEDKNVLVDAQQLNRPSVMYKNTPLLADFSGIVAVPKPGQRCVISKDSSGFEYVDGVLTGPNNVVKELKKEEFVMQFDPETKIKFSKDGSGGFDISINASGNVDVTTEGDISIDSSGDVDVTAEGDIRVGENGEKVAKQNHTHPYTWSNPGGSGNTSKPNESGTETLIK